MATAVSHARPSTDTSSKVDSAIGKVGRALFALPFAVFGVNHFLHGDAMAGMVPLPGGVFWVYLTGAALVLGALGILTGATRSWGKWAALGLAALMLVFVLAVHVPGLSNPQMAQMSMISLLKDLSLAGGALTYASLLGRKARA